MKAFRELSLILALSLTACNKALPPPKLAETPKPLAVDARLCADLKPEPKVQGSIISPVTPEEQEVVRLFLNSYTEALDWGRQGWARAKIAKGACSK